MKFIHLADLHLGKIAYQASMLDDQEYILREILDITDRVQPDAAVIAGDIYDRSVPSEEAIALFEDFLAELSGRDIPVFVISGNHDSATRLGFGSKFMARSNIYISPPFTKAPEPITLQDEFGPVNFYLLPFIKPYQVRAAYPNDAVDSFENAVAVAIHHMDIDPRERNILVAHQFVDGSKIGDFSGAEVGGLDKVSRDVFRDFDYTALGHIHKPQNMGPYIRYSGTPMKYSFSDVNQTKSVTIVTLGEKGDVTVDYESEPLIPKRDMRTLKGSYDEIIRLPKSEDYLDITLTDSQTIADGMYKLRQYFPNTLTLSYDNETTRNEEELSLVEDARDRDPLELFEQFFHQRQGKDLTERQKEIVETLIGEIWEGNE